MRAHDDLDAQIAQRLFGETWTAQTPIWMNRPCPPYSTDPAATALVWQWVERQPLTGGRVWYIEYTYGLSAVVCTIIFAQQHVDAVGATWPEALCRAALALAEAREEA